VFTIVTTESEPIALTGKTGTELTTRQGTIKQQRLTQRYEEEPWQHLKKYNLTASTK